MKSANFSNPNIRDKHEHNTCTDQSRADILRRAVFRT